MEQGFEHALAQLKANELTGLNLSFKSLTEVQVIRLAEALKYNQSLTALNLEGNRCVAAEIEKFSEALKMNQTLIVLNLSRIQLNAVGAESLSAVLKLNRTLTTLYLHHNRLSVAGAEKISAALKVNQTLTNLGLGFNLLGVAGAEKVSEALKLNQSLTTLHFPGNLVDNATEQGIKAALENNKNRIKSIRNQTLLTLVILLRQAHSPTSMLPFELWQIILRQLDFPSLNKGYRTSHTLASFFTQKNTLNEFNQRLQSKQSVRLIETHGPKPSESRFSFLTPPITLLPGAANPIAQAIHEEAEPQPLFLSNNS